ncbi:MAG TPA: alanine racemase [Acidimicrobiaceae bacterium]|nr:alanine racemase [Acidimicrobiaceae bacterium]|tara:strand:- start:12 stop:1145 length:1134 start_codon:yes stop_codon:yes gene_type:complete
MRPTWVSVDLAAVDHNVSAFRRLVGDAEVCAVVKADGYGHGAPAVAAAAIDAGATWLAVALVEEASELRAEGISEPVLVLSEPRPDEMADVVALGGVRPTLYTEAGIEACAAAVVTDGAIDFPVHLKVDTGMHRVGVHCDKAVTAARRILKVGLSLEGVFSHCSNADVPEDPFTDIQVERFDNVLSDLASAGIQPRLVHLANTAATLTRPDTYRSLVRVGIGVYGVSPGPALDAICRDMGLRQAMTVRSEITHLQVVGPGEGVGYGQHWVSERTTRLGTVPMGYADGLARIWGLGGEALVRGRRCPLRGAVSMDALVVEVDDEMELGDEVVLLGSQDNDEISASEVAKAVGLIPWEVLCSLSHRPPRRYSSKSSSRG